VLLHMRVFNTNDLCYAIYSMGESPSYIGDLIKPNHIFVVQSLKQGLISLGEPLPDGSIPVMLTERGLNHGREVERKRAEAQEQARQKAAEAERLRIENEKTMQAEKERLEQLAKEPLTELEKNFLNDLWRIYGKAGGEVESEEWLHKYANARELFDNLKLKKYLDIWKSDLGVERFEFSVKAIDTLKQKPAPKRQLILPTGEKVDIRSGAITLILAASAEILENDIESIIFNDLSKDGATNRKVRRACIMELKRILKLRGDDLKPETCNLIQSILTNPFRFVWDKSLWQPGTYLWKGETYIFHGLPDMEA